MVTPVRYVKSFTVAPILVIRSLQILTDRRIQKHSVPPPPKITFQHISRLIKGRVRREESVYDKENIQACHSNAVNRFTTPPRVKIIPSEGNSYANTPENPRHIVEVDPVDIFNIENEYDRAHGVTSLMVQKRPPLHEKGWEP